MNNNTQASLYVKEDLFIYWPIHSQNYSRVVGLQVCESLGNQADVHSGDHGSPASASESKCVCVNVGVCVCVCELQAPSLTPHLSTATKGIQQT